MPLMTHSSPAASSMSGRARQLPAVQWGSSSAGVPCQGRSTSTGRLRKRRRGQSTPSTGGDLLDDVCLYCSVQGVLRGWVLPEGFLIGLMLTQRWSCCKGCHSGYGYQTYQWIPLLTRLPSSRQIACSLLPHTVMVQEYPTACAGRIETHA